MNDKIKINLQIADSNYPLTINREEEQMQRNDTTPYTEKVKELTELLEDYFQKE